MTQFNETDFALHPQLEADCYFVTDLPLCRVLMMNDSQYPWLILVPRVSKLREVIDLNLAQEQQLWKESRLVNEALNALYQPDKLNLAALGNMVPQLHLHHIARFFDDPAWPGPVWGAVKPQPYTQENAKQRIDDLNQVIKERLC